ncbi:Carotenoid 9,10 [Penicillium rolfsii]|nr:Carotenoid 9,10 [Penicillium rolfsii]
MTEPQTSVTKAKHRCLSGNFAPIHRQLPLTPCTYSGTIPVEFRGGQYVRNGGNPSFSDHLSEDVHMFDGDGMLSGIWFQVNDQSKDVEPSFVNRYILTDIYLGAKSMPGLRLPILPSIATLTHPLRSTISTFFRLCRFLSLIAWSFISPEKHQIRKISVANTAVLYHDKRVLATCQTGPPMRVQLPNLDTIGWFNGYSAVNEEKVSRQGRDAFGGNGPFGFLKDWTTAHPHVDPDTGDLISFQSSFLPPFVWYSLIPKTRTKSQPHALHAPVPGVSIPKLMHDFGVSPTHTVILDLPMTLDPTNMLRGRPIIHYDRNSPSRFGIFPRRHPEQVRWFETEPCFIFHTASTWDEPASKLTENSEVDAVSMVACRYTNGNMLYSMGAIEPIEKENCDSQLYYYRFLLSDTENNTITQQWALSAIPFEMPIVPTSHPVSGPQFVYGCSSRDAMFGAATGEPMKMDCLVKIDVQTLIRRGIDQDTPSIDGCVDKRNIQEIASSDDPQDPIKIFQAPKGWYAQEPQFVPREGAKEEDDGYLLTLMFDETQLDVDGHAGEDSRSELWIIDARDMTSVVAKIFLPQRVPYGFHGHWFSKEEIDEQRPYARLRTERR